MKLLKFKPFTDGVSGDYPFGNMRDDAPPIVGTDADTEFMGDYVQFFEKMFDESGIVANGFPDNATNDFQLYEAFRKLTKPYKIYSALITQAGTNDPTVIVLGPNEIGNIVWTRLGIGQYRGTLVGAFTVNQTALIKSPEQGNDILTTMVAASGDTVNISTYISGVLSDNFLGGAFIEIRVYD